MKLAPSVTFYEDELILSLSHRMIMSITEDGCTYALYKNGSWVAGRYDLKNNPVPALKEIFMHMEHVRKIESND